MRLAVIIPARNEEKLVAEAVRSAFSIGADEVVVSDGGSTDGTREMASSAGAAVVTGEQMRARQLNQGAASTTSEVLLFLHADTLLPDGAKGDIERAIASGALFGGFRIRFAESAGKLLLAAAMINLRTRLTLCPWGDQAQFITREAFLAEGGYPELPIMEDYELARRMKRKGRSVLLSSSVTTSGRRFLERGVLATAATNWRIIAAYHRGIPADELRDRYSRRR